MLKTFANTVFGWKYLIDNMFLKNKNKNKNKLKTKNLLIIAWIFPPNISGGVYRPLSFARYASRAGWKVTVACRDNINQPSTAGLHLLEQIKNENIEIIHIEESTKKTSYRFFPRIDGGILNSFEIREKITSKIFDSPDVILASGPPFHVFIAGTWLSKYYNSSLVLDFRDEWSLCEFDFVQQGNSDQFFEEYCLSRADNVIFTTKSSLQAYQKKYPRLPAQKLCVVHNGWEPDDFQPIDLPTNAPTTKTISFIGYLGDHTPADNFLSDLTTVLALRPEFLKIFKFNFIGSKDSSAKNTLSEFSYPEAIEITSHIPKHEAINAMACSTALLLINLPRLHRYIPGKLFDYIASGTPILLYGEGGEVGEIVQKTESGLIVPIGDIHTLENSMNKLLGGWRPPSSPERSRWLAEHSRSKLAEKFLTLIEHDPYNKANQKN